MCTVQQFKPQNISLSAQPLVSTKYSWIFALQVMLAMDDTGALLRFVQRPNDVDLREGELALRARGRYSELVALYQQRGQHEAALDLLHTLTLSPQDLKIRPQGVEAIRALFDLFICGETIWNKRCVCGLVRCSCEHCHISR